MAREARDWTQLDLAQKLGTSKGSVSRWEQDKSYPGGRYLVKLGEVLDLEANWWGAPTSVQDDTAAHQNALTPAITKQELLRRARRLAERFRERLLIYVASDLVTLQDKLTVVDVLWPAQVDVVTRPAFPIQPPEEKTKADPVPGQRGGRPPEGPAIPKVAKAARR